LLVTGYWLLVICYCLSPIPIGDVRPMFDMAGQLMTNYNQQLTNS